MVGMLCVASSCEAHLASCRKAASTQLPQIIAFGASSLRPESILPMSG